MTEEERQSIIDEIKEQLLADMVDITKLPKGDATDGASLPVLQHSELVIQELNNFIGVYDIDVERQSADSDIVNIYLKNAAGVVIKTIVTNAATLEQVNTKVAKINESLTLISSSLSAKQDTLKSGVNIKTINGTSLLGSGDVVVVGSGADKHGAAYPNGHTDKPYHKVASVSSAVNATLDTNISFYVSEFYNDTSCGILNISLRWTANSTNFKFNRIFWSLNVGIDVNNFVLGWTVVDGIVTCNLYVKRTSWTSYALKRLDEQAWGNSKDLWQCYNATYPNNCYATIPDANTVVSVNEIISNNVNTAKKLTTARTIALSGGAKGETSFDGSSNVNIPVTALYDTPLAYKTLSDRNTEAKGLTLMDAVNGQFIANRLAFKRPDNILIEYSNDGGTNWNTSTHTDETKVSLVSGIGTNLYLGNKTTGQTNQDKLRITIFAAKNGMDFYSTWQRLYVYLGTNGAAGLQCTYEYSLRDTPDNWVSQGDWGMTGWSGWNKLSNVGSNAFGGKNSSSHPFAIRLTFWFMGHASGYENKTSACIYKVELRGITTYANYTGCKLAETGHMYDYDWQKNVTFPNAIKGKKLITNGGKSTQVVKGDGSLEEESALAVASAIDAEHAIEADYAGVADKADKFTTARTISLSGGAVGTATAFDGSKNINIPVTKIDEGILAWSENYAQRGTLLDNIMKISGNNVLAFMPPSAITIEYSTDNGVTWLDYGWNDNYKTAFVTPEFGANGLFLGKNSSSLSSNNRLRITFDFIAANMRFTPSKACIYFSGVNNSDSFYTKLSIEKYNNYNKDVWEEFTNQKITGDDWGTFRLSTEDWGYKYGTYRARFRCEFYRTADSIHSTAIGNMIIMATKIVNANPYAKNRHLYTFDYQQNATFPARVKATKLVTNGGTNQQVLLGDGSLKALSEISPITDADADILLDNHIHSIDVNANGNNVNISVIESSKIGNNWETEDNNITIPLATPTSAGVMSKEDKAKLDGNISIEPDSGMPDFIGDFEYSDVDYEAIIDLTTIDWINWVEGGLFVMNAEETWEEDNGDTSYHQCVVTFIYRANGCIPISIVNTNKMTAKMSGMVITINLTEGTGELRFKQIKLI